jgi:Holliday junction resolvase RusA-like endonuclease
MPAPLLLDLHHPGGPEAQRAVPTGSEGVVVREPRAGDIEVSMTLYFGTKRKADLDNFNKLSLDALTGIA